MVLQPRSAVVVPELVVHKELERSCQFSYHALSSELRLYWQQLMSQVGVIYDVLYQMKLRHLCSARTL